MSDVSSSSDDYPQRLRGYRIFFLRRLVYTDSDARYRRGGADLLYMPEETPPSSAEEFKTWWQSEVAKASQDGRTMVVLSTHKGNANHKKWLEAIEEDEWCEGDIGTGRVRCTTQERLRKTLNQGAVLTDMWDDEIAPGTRVTEERGGATVDDDSSASASEAEFVAPQNISF